MPRKNHPAQRTAASPPPKTPTPRAKANKSKPRSKPTADEPLDTTLADPADADTETAKAKSKSRKNPGLLRFAVGESGIVPKEFFADRTYDLYASANCPLHPNSPGLVQTQTHVILPVGTIGFIVGRYSTFHDRGLLVPTLVLSPGFRGEIKVPIRNMTKQQITVKRRERIAQLVVLSVVAAQVLAQDLEDLEQVPAESEAERGTTGAGSTGR